MLTQIILSFGYHFSFTKLNNLSKGLKIDTILDSKSSNVLTSSVKIAVSISEMLVRTKITVSLKKYTLNKKLFMLLDDFR